MVSPDSLSIASKWDHNQPYFGGVCAAYLLSFRLFFCCFFVWWGLCCLSFKISVGFFLVFFLVFIFGSVFNVAGSVSELFILDFSVGLL
jgi:hypothetical protein